MSKNEKIGIIGGGRFGLTLAEALSDNGVDVVLVDKNWDIVQSLADSRIHAVHGDATVPAVLRDAGFADCSTAVIAIGSAVEASTLATLNCKDLKIERIFAKADSELHGRILSRIGADHIIQPDRDRAMRLASSILHHSPVDFFGIGDGHAVAEIAVPEQLVGKTLIEGNVRQTLGLTVLAILRQRSDDPTLPRTSIIPTGKETLDATDRLVVFGKDEDVDKHVG